MPAPSPEPIKLSSPGTRQFWEIPVLHEDQHLLALDKPPGLLTSPDRDDPHRPNLMKLLHAAIAEQKPWAAQRGLAYLSNVHRLDFETSGVILLAKSKEVLVSLADAFGSELVKRKYIALVQGAPHLENDSGTFEVDAKLAPHPAMPHIVRIDRKRGKKARTAFSILERFRGWTLLSCQAFTDRTHQVRVHLKSMRLPLVADSLYGGQPLRLSRLKPGYRASQSGSERPLLSRVALHAEELTLEHPRTKQPIRIYSPWPKDFQVSLKYLRLYASVP
jgi:23S rRNA pseudouridine955/2504/2580 synthase